MRGPGKGFEMAALNSMGGGSLSTRTEFFSATAGLQSKARGGSSGLCSGKVVPLVSLGLDRKEIVQIKAR